VNERIATRHLRVVKYRGSLHGTNEYPFLIGDDGISVLPITSLGLNYAVSSERISSGIARLDSMLGGQGFFRGGSILLTGTPGTGKTSVAAYFAHAAARRGERALFFTFEESPNQIIRNMHSIGLRLDPWVKRGVLRFHAARPTLYGLEMHLATMFKEITAFQPAVVIVDPMTSLLAAGSEYETRATVMRLIDFLKAQQITSLFTSLTQEGSALQQSEIAISSLMDSWLLLQNIESDGERNRGLYVLKSRGMAHSNQIREFVMSQQGVDLVDAYIGPGGLLVGAARAAQSAREKAAALASQQEGMRLRSTLERKHTAVERQIAALRSEYEAEEQEAQRADEQAVTRTHVLTTDRAEQGRLRQADAKRAVSAREHTKRSERKR
jgi:circadian clock protein KaiC